MERERYEKVKDLVTKYNLHYYTYDEPLVPDSVYDTLYQELVEMEEKHPEWITADSPTQRVGGKLLGGFEAKRHTRELYSLDKAQIVEKFIKWYNDIYAVVKNPFFMTLELKFDGLTLVARYENRLLVEIRTRGNGVVGEVITETAKTIKSIPLRIPYEGVVEFQGEGYMLTDKMNQYNEKKEPEFASAIAKMDHKPDLKELKKLRRKYFISNERNGAAGSLRNHDPKIASERQLDAFFYNIAYIEGKDLSSQSEMMQFIKEQGLKTNPYFFETTSPEEIIQNLNEIEHQLRPTLNYAIDGAVIKVNDLSLRQSLGYTSKFPRWAIAYKFEADQVATTVLEIKAQVGRTGQVTPVCIVEAVELGGVEVTRATLNNYDNIKLKGVYVGARVWIRRSNDVIPEIIGVIEEEQDEKVQAKEVTLPTHCPECNAELIQDGANLYCTNQEGCPAQQIKKFIHFASRDAMDIEGFGDETSELLYQKNILKTFVDLYQLKAEQIIGFPGFAKKKSEKLIQSIEKSKNRPLNAFLFALGIRHIGKETAEKIANHFENIDAIAIASIEELLIVDDVGSSGAQSIYEYFHDEKKKELIQKLKELGVTMQHEARVMAGSKFSGKIFVITGEMPSGKKRNEIKNQIQSQGGKVSGSVSKKTNYVIYGEKAGSKLTDAEELIEKGHPIQLLTEKEYEELIKL